MVNINEYIQKYRLVIVAGIILLAVGLIAFMGKKEEPVVHQVAKAEDHRGVTVLNYHKIDNTFHSLSVRPEDFEKQMKWLSQHGYHTITPDQLYEFVTDGTELPDNPVMITFDDGYVDNYKNAYPIMKKYGFVGTIFVVTTYLEKYPNYLTWDQARELEANGFSIESHTAKGINLHYLFFDPSILIHKWEI